MAHNGFGVWVVSGRRIQARHRHGGSPHCATAPTRRSLLGKTDCRSPSPHGLPSKASAICRPVRSTAARGGGNLHAMPACSPSPFSDRASARCPHTVLGRASRRRTRIRYRKPSSWSGVPVLAWSSTRRGSGNRRDAHMHVVPEHEIPRRLWTSRMSRASSAMVHAGWSASC